MFVLDKEKIIEFCKKIKEVIDWDFDSYSGYQEMMKEIDSFADKIIKTVNSQ